MIKISNIKKKKYEKNLFYKINKKIKNYKFTICTVKEEE
jgi:hypothetical protein